MEGDNPMSERGLMAFIPQVFFNRAVTSMHNSVRRLSTRLSVLVGAGAGGAGGSQAGGSALNSPRSDGGGANGDRGGDDPYKHAYDNPALALESARRHNGEQSDEEEEEEDYYYNDDDGHNYEGEGKYDEYNANNNAGAVYRTRIKYGPSSDSGDEDDNYDNDNNYAISSNEISPRRE